MVAVPDGDPRWALGAVGLAALVGVQLGGWQRFALEAMLRRVDGHWASFENACVVPRQNGKSVILLVRALAGALLFGERLVIVSAHEWRTVVELFRTCTQYVMDSPVHREECGTSAVRWGRGDRVHGQEPDQVP